MASSPSEYHVTEVRRSICVDNLGTCFVYLTTPSPKYTCMGGQDSTRLIAPVPQERPRADLASTHPGSRVAAYISMTILPLL